MFLDLLIDNIIDLSIFDTKIYIGFYHGIDLDRFPSSISSTHILTLFHIYHLLSINV